MPRLAHSARRLPAAALAAALTTLAACGGGGDGPTSPATATGQFSGTVAGHVARSMKGVAFYGEVREGGETGFAVGMGALAADQKTYNDLIVIGRGTAGAPAAGTYDLYAIYNPESESDADEPPADRFVLVSTLKQANANDLTCFGTSGKVTFQAAAGGHLKGSYTAQATCIDLAAPEAERQVTLAGSFDAVQSTSVPSTGRAARLAAR